LPAGAEARSLWVISPSSPEVAAMAAQLAQELISRYVGAWNNPDPVRRRAELASVYARDASIVTAGGVFAGIDAVAQHVAEVYEEFIAPGRYRFSNGGSVGHHDCILFRWEMREVASGELADAGMNLFVRSAAGLIMGDYQFVLGVDSAIGSAGSVAA
jgi:SnoaL-like domain